MNDDDLRSILHEEGDRIEPGDHSWSRLESRLQPAKRSAERSRAFAFGTVAIAVVVSLAAVVLWVGREQPRTQVAVVPRPGPARILAVKGDGWLVLLDARTGTELRRYLANPAPGTPIAVSPDARHFYFASGDGNAGCQRETIQRRPIDPGPEARPLPPVQSNPRSAPMVATSPITTASPATTVPMSWLCATWHSEGIVCGPPRRRTSSGSGSSSTRTHVTSSSR